MSSHLLTDDELAKVIAVSIKAFAQNMGYDLNGKILSKTKTEIQRAINLFEGKEQENPKKETYAQEFVRIYNEETEGINN